MTARRPNAPETGADLPNQIIATLRERGNRATTARRILLAVLLASYGHRTAEERAALVQDRAPGIHLTTIYRNLDVAGTHRHRGPGQVPARPRALSRAADGLRLHHQTATLRRHRTLRRLPGNLSSILRRGGWVEHQPELGAARGASLGRHRLGDPTQPNRHRRRPGPLPALATPR
jgi:Ferric uptake regulator family